MSNYHVVSRGENRWAVVKEGARRAASIHSSKAEAVQAAEALLTGRPDSRILLEGELSAGSVREPRASYGTPWEADGAKAFARAFGDRIRRARVMRGYSLRDLAEALDGLCSHTHLQKLEKGLAEADSALLAGLSRVLKLRPDYFFESAALKLQGVEYRSQAKVGMKARESLLEQAFEFFERYLEIESLLGLQMGELPPFDLRRIAGVDLPEAVEQAAVTLRKEWELGMNPIPNVHAMLEQKGVKVKMLSEAPKGFDGFSAFADAGNQRVPVLALAKLEDLPRQRLTALHELAHLVLQLPETLETKVKENLCNRFAGAVLLPKEPFEALFGTSRVRVPVRELVAIKAEWGISCSGVMKRAHNLEIITDGHYKYFCINARKNKWHEGEPGKKAWVGSEESMRFRQLVLRALAQEVITASKAAGLLNQSIDEIRKDMSWSGE